MINEKILGYTKNNQAVYFDENSGHAATHFNNHPNLEKVVSDTLTKIVATQDIERHDTDTGEIIGNTDLVETDPTDDVVYALRKGRTIYSRFCKIKLPLQPHG